MSMDTTDRRILAALQIKGRMSNAELSEKVNLSPSACHRRVQQLEADGYIRNYVALLDARILANLQELAYMIKAKSEKNA